MDDLNSPPLTDPSQFEIHQFATAGPAAVVTTQQGPGEVSVRGYTAVGLKCARDPKRGTRGKPGGFLLI